VRIKPRAFRDALAQFPTGVCVVTSKTSTGEPTGVTINAFSSVSLDPPLVLFCIGRTSASIDSYVKGLNFAVNVLSEQQRDTSERFATRDVDKFSGQRCIPAANGCLLLDDAVVALECGTRSVYEEGDHYIIIGEVERIMPLRGIRPLVWHRSGYAAIVDLPAADAGR
jgi:flavin reductase (DIM6/NTAB) family NADH-FMN oxidoreductase RutF